MAIQDGGGAVTPDEADWVFEHVLTRAYKSSTDALERGAAHLRTCACLWGPCGYCKAGRPDRCAHRDGRTGAARAPIAYVVTRDGGAMDPVWPSGRSCKWVCPGPNLRDATQPTLFELAS